MILTLNNSRGKVLTSLLPIILATAYLVIFMLALRTYIIWQSVNLILGLLSLPFITSIDGASRSSKRFAIAAIAITLLAWVLPVKTMLFVSMLFAVLFLIENFYGKINLLPVLACLLISPFFQYVVSVFSFSIRIMLSSVAGKLLNYFGDAVVVYGNIIEMKGKEFAVDPACMGLNMMVTSVLLAIVLIGVFQKKFSKVISLWKVAIILLIVSVFNIISNLLRILVLVKFSIMPENAMHEITGLIFLMMYVFIPSVLLVKWIIKRFGTGKNMETFTGSRHTIQIQLHLLLLLSIALLSFKVDQKEPAKLLLPKALPLLNHSTIESVEDNIIKITSDDMLIYVKPISNFYDGEHNPSICWKGSGYAMKKIRNIDIQKVNVNTAVLEKEASLLYTAWWFDNGEEQTTSQFEWRWKMFKGSKPFSVINITAATEEELKKQVSYFLRAKINQQILLPKYP